MELKRQKNKINALYIFLVVSTVLSFVPNASAQILSLALITLVLIAAYLYRHREEEDSLLYNHMTYMIGTIWIGTAVMMVGMFLLGFWVYAQGDHTIIHNTVNNFQNGVMYDEAAMRQVMQDYLSANQSFLIKASLPTIGPAILYIVYRVANGYSRAMKGYRIAKPTSWL